MSLKKICICLILIFCIIGAASAAEDVSTDVVDASDDAVAVDAVSDDVSDSLESVVEDEPVVVDSASAQDEIDDELSGQSHDVLGADNSDILSLTNSDVFYVNVSSSSDPETVDGQSWATAFGTPSGITAAKIYINDGGIIYLANGDYKYRRVITIDEMKNITFIGQGQDTLINNFLFDYNSVGNTTYTFINMTFFNTDFNRNCTFINCNFKDDITFFKNFNSGRYEDRYLEEHGFLKTYSLEFINCTFGQTTTDSYYMGVNRCAQLNFNNCTFKDIVANSLVYRIAGYFEEDSISFKDCTFTNCEYNGVVDSAANFDEAIVIEDCNYDDEVAVGTTEVNGHFYVNATKLKVVAVDSAVDISSSEKGVVVITLTDGTNPIAGATVKYTVNGGEEQTVTTGDDGKATISGLTGEVTIAVNYEGNESYNAISDTKSFNFTEEPVVPAKVATKITAPKVSAVYNVAKNLVITLTDKDGKALANKKVTVKVGTISKTLTTNAKGQVSLNVATLVPKTYTATVKFAGDDGYLASSLSPKVVVSKAKPKITAKAKTFKVKVKTKKYTVTLKNNKGKVMKKVKLTLKVGKKTYKATTNSKGKATFKITKLTKKGKYTATVKFAGSKYYKALSKKVKITVKK